MASESKIVTQKTRLTTRQVLTGSYHNYFRIYDVNGDNDVVLQADKSAFKAKKIGGARGKTPGKKEGLQTDGIDFAKKIVSDGFRPRLSPASC